MRLWLGLILSCGLICSPMARAADPSEDQALWTAVNDLNKRFLVTQLGHNIEPVLIASALVFYSGLAGSVFLDGSLRVLRPFANKLLFVSIAPYVMLTSVYIDAIAKDRKFDQKNRMILGQNDPERHAQKALLAHLKFFRKPMLEQFSIARANPEFGAYLVELDQWILGGVMNAAPPPVINPPR